MANELQNSLGDTGQLLCESSQDFLANHLYVTAGACLGICAKHMTVERLSAQDAKHKLPTVDDYLETLQWVEEDKDRKSQRVDELAASANLKRVATLNGRLLYDEIEFSNFVRKVGQVPSFNIFGFIGAQETGHALLLWESSDGKWLLFDPNFGIAEWPHAGSMIVGLKRLLRLAYSHFGPYIKFSTFKFEPDS